MALDEAMRHRIHGRLEELLGTDEAAALMAELSSQDRLLTRIDRLETKLDSVEQRLDAKIDGVEERLDAKIDHVHTMLVLQIKESTANVASELRTEMNSMMRMTLQWMTGSILAAGSLGIAAGRLL